MDLSSPLLTGIVFACGLYGAVVWAVFAGAKSLDQRGDKLADHDATAHASTGPPPPLLAE